MLVWVGAYPSGILAYGGTSTLIQWLTGLDNGALPGGMGGFEWRGSYALWHRGSS